MIVTHGTSEENKNIIIENKRFYKSTDTTEWAGSGIYFFCDDDIEASKSNAYKWAKYIKKYDKPAVIILIVDIKKDDEYLLDLTDIENKKLFHEFREKYFRSAMDRIKEGKYSRTILASMLDCGTINTICENMGYKAVMRDVYINFSKNKFKEKYGEYYYSQIPNCVIMALRDETLIKEWGNWQ